jgi:hypothetical protein
MWRGLRDATVGSMSDRVRRGFFASLSPPFSGKTEVTRELDKARPSPLSKADRSMRVGTPVRWERAVHREGRAAFFIRISWQLAIFLIRFAFLNY